VIKYEDLDTEVTSSTLYLYEGGFSGTLGAFSAFDGRVLFVAPKITTTEPTVVTIDGGGVAQVIETEMGVLTSGAAPPRAVADAEWMWVARTTGSTRVYRLNNTATDWAQRNNIGGGNPYQALLIDDQFVYAIHASGSLYRVPRSGSTFTQMSASLGDSGTIRAAAAGFDTLCWGGNFIGTEEVVCFETNGTALPRLAIDAGLVSAIAIDHESGELFWAVETSTEITLYGIALADLTVMPTTLWESGDTADNITHIAAHMGALFALVERAAGSPDEVLRLR